ncbi:MAG: glycosyltransferase family 87 protein, partial [Chitinophagaceae bacterium]
MIQQFKIASNKKNKLFSFLSQPKTIITVWILIALIFAIQGLITFRYNNYLIFKYTFPHLIKRLPLYAHYFKEYGDISHYGPLFSIFITPFYFLPDWIGLPLWDILNAVVLWYAIQILPIKKQHKIFIEWLAVPGLIASTLSEQFNPMAGAFILFSYIFIQREKEGASAFFIILGTAIKLYGIVGLAFFFFSKRKKQFIGYLLLWSVVLFVLPMLFSTPGYIIHSYTGWFEALVSKNDLNMTLTSSQDVSVMGIFRRVFLNPHISNFPFWIAGVILFSSVYLHWR